MQYSSVKQKHICSIVVKRWQSNFYITLVQQAQQNCNFLKITCGFKEMNYQNLGLLFKFWFDVLANK
jgi:hypothetical protein